MDSKFELRLSDTLQNTIDSSVDQICGVHLQATELELSSAIGNALPHNVNGTLEQYAGFDQAPLSQTFNVQQMTYPFHHLLKLLWHSRMSLMRITTQMYQASAQERTCNQK